jgi:hypothetical protein
MSTATLNKPTKPAPQAQTQAASQVPPQPPSGRDAKGRFLPGNPGGPGNPFARQVAQIRKAVINKLTVEEIGLMIDTFKCKAIGGDLASAKFLFQYVIGKPGEAVNPDTLDIEEFRQIYLPRKEIMKHVNDASGTLDPATCSALVRFLSLLNHAKMADMVSKSPEERGKIMEALGGAPAVPQKPTDEKEDDRHLDESLDGEGDDLDDEDDYDDELGDEWPPSAKGGNRHAGPSTKGGNGHAGAAVKGGNGHAGPSTKGGNGQATSSTKGGNGQGGPSTKSGNGHATPSTKGGNGHATPSTKGRNGKHKAGKPTTNGKNRIAFPMRRGSRF